MNLLCNETLDAMNFAHKINDGILFTDRPCFAELEAAGYAEKVGLPPPADITARLTEKGETVATALFGPGRRTARTELLRKW